MHSELPPEPSRPPRRDKQSPLVIAGIVAGSLIATAALVGLMAWFLWWTSEPKPAVKVTPPLVIGTHTYIQACQLFTASDFKELTSQEADQYSINTTYAQELPKDTKNKSFTAACGRRAPLAKAEDAENISYFVDITQYSSDNLAADLLLRQNERSTPQLVEQFGQGANVQGSFTGTSRALEFFYENKIIKIRGQGTFAVSQAALDPKLLSLGAAMLKKLKSPNGAEVFTPGSTNQRVGDFAYVPACRLFEADQFKAATDRPLNLSSIEAVYAEKTDGAAATLAGACELTTDEAADSRWQVRIETAQSATREMAIYRYENSLDGAAKEIPHVADKAQILPNKVRILKNNVVVTLTLVNGFKGTPSEAEATLTKLAQMVTSRL